MGKLVLLLVALIGTWGFGNGLGMRLPSVWNPLQTVTIPDQSLSDGNTNLTVFTVKANTNYILTCSSNHNFTLVPQSVQWQFFLSAGTATGWWVANQIISGLPQPNQRNPALGWDNVEMVESNWEINGAVLTYVGGQAMWNINVITVTFRVTESASLTAVIQANIWDAPIPSSQIWCTLQPL